MDQTVLLLLALMSVFCTTNGVYVPCTGLVGSSDLSQCHCTINDTFQIVAMNCTGLGLIYAPLHELPDTVVNLTFVGNNIPELPINIFGNRSMDNLVYLDLSRNNITVIHGKTFHGVPKVEKLILDQNQWMLTDRTRALSNFYNLRFLSLNNAIKKQLNSTTAHITRLGWILEDSNLVKVEEFHLEFNEVSFVDPNIFCPLKSLRIVRMSNNDIFDTAGLFNAKCMDGVQEMYLHNNSISYFDEEEIDEVKKMATENLTVLSLADNPWRCTCKLKPFLRWLNTSSAARIVKDRDQLKCTRYEHDGSYLIDLDIDSLECTKPNNLHHILKAPYVIIGLLLAAICVVTAAFIWCRRHDIRNQVRKVSVPIIAKWNSKGPDYQGLV